MKKYITIVLVLIYFSVSAAYKIGDTARDFSLKNVDGKEVSMAGYNSAKGFIVVFTCNHCPFAKAYESRIMDLDRKYASKGYPVIAINPNDPAAEPEDSYENMIRRSDEMKYSFPYLFDETQEIASAYGATRTPHVFILNRENGKLVVKYIGAIDNNTEDPEKADRKYVEEAVDALIAGKSVPLAETKAIGCTIKWKN
jgi:peroxiredoxin